MDESEASEATSLSLSSWRAFFSEDLSLEMNPVKEVADFCRIGAAINVNFGLALGYKSVVFPIFDIAIAIYVSFSFAAMYGISVYFENAQHYRVLPLVFQLMLMAT
nr:pyrophosphate-energized vacuolar membrane proton pump [Quercus suber]